MRVAVIDWSGTGNTESMAEAMEKGLKEGGAETVLLSVEQADAAVVDRYDAFAFGCPSMGDEVLEESAFEPFFESVEGKLGSKKVALFGSYGWGDGQWMRDWEERVRQAGATLYGEGLIVMGGPDEDECKAYGKAFAASRASKVNGE